MPGRVGRGALAAGPGGGADSPSSNLRIVVL